MRIEIEELDNGWCIFMTLGGLKSRHLVYKTIDKGKMLDDVLQFLKDEVFTDE